MYVVHKFCSEGFVVGYFSLPFQITVISPQRVKSTKNDVSTMEREAWMNFYFFTYVDVDLDI